MAINHKKELLFVILKIKKSFSLNKKKENILSKKNDLFLGKKKIFEVIKDNNNKIKSNDSGELDDFDLIKEYKKKKLSKSCNQNCDNIKNEFFECSKESSKKEDDLLSEDVFPNFVNVENNQINKKIHNNKCESGIINSRKDI